MYNVYKIVNPDNKYLKYVILTDKEFKQLQKEFENDKRYVYPCEPNDIAQEAIEARRKAHQMNLSQQKSGENAAQKNEETSTDPDSGETIITVTEKTTATAEYKSLEAFKQLKHSEKSNYIEKLGLADEVDRRSSQKMIDYYEYFLSNL